MTIPKRNLGVAEQWGRVTEQEIADITRRLRALEGSRKISAKSQSILASLVAKGEVKDQLLQDQFDFQNTVVYETTPPTAGIDDPGDPDEDGEVYPDPDSEEGENPSNPGGGGDDDPYPEPEEDDSETIPEVEWVYVDPDTGRVEGEWHLIDEIWEPRQIGSGAIAPEAVIREKIEQAIIDDIDEANSNANIAVEAANGKNTIYRGPDEPSNPTGGFRPGDTWFDTSDPNGDILIKIWDGSGWQLEKVSQSSLSETIQDAIDEAQSQANFAVQAVNGKNSIYRGPDSPTPPSGGFLEGDTWFDTSGEFSVIKTWDGSDWVEESLETGELPEGVLDDIQEALDNSTVALQAANGKNTTYRGPNTPVVPSDGHREGDIWFDTSGSDVALKTWDGVSWVTEELGEDNIAAGAITAGKIDAGAVTSAKIDASAVTAEKIASGAVEAGKIKAGAITADDGVIASLDAGVISAGTLNSDRIAANSISGSKLLISSIDGDRLKDGTISGTLIEDGAITTNKIAANAITAESGIIASLDAAVISTGTLNSDRIGSRTITAEKLLVGRSRDLAPGPGGYEELYEDGSGNPANIVSSGNDPSGAYISIPVDAALVAERSVYGPFVPVRQEEVISWESYATYGGTNPGTNWSTYVYWYDAQGQPLASPERTVVTNETQSGGTTGWSRGTVTVPDNAEYARARFYTTRDAAASGSRGFRNLDIRVQTSGTLIEEGAITTDKIAANAVVADKLAANSVTAGKVAANAITADKIRSNAIDGMTITGATLQSSASANTGVKIVGQNISLYSSQGGYLYTTTLSSNLPGSRGSGLEFKSNRTNGASYINVSDTLISGSYVSQLKVTAPGSSGLMLLSKNSTTIQSAEGSGLEAQYYNSYLLGAARLNTTTAPYQQSIYWSRSMTAGDSFTKTFGVPVPQGTRVTYGVAHSSAPSRQPASTMTPGPSSNTVYFHRTTNAATTMYFHSVWVASQWTP